MSLESQSTNITIIGAPWSGKTTIWKLIVQEIPKLHFHDMDDDWLQNKEVGWWDSGVAKKLSELWDEGFVDAEGEFVIENYGTRAEGKKFNLDNILFSSTWSLPLHRKAMNHIRARSHVILIDVPMPVLVGRSSPTGRPDGNTRIVGMNGKTPRFQTLAETLEYRWAIYRQCADVIVTYKEESPIETARIVADIIHKLQ